MRVGLITTLNTNIGDDFIREGIQFILHDLFRPDEEEIEYIAVNKHQPFTVYPSCHPLRWLPRGKRMLSGIISKPGFSLFDNCDLIVQCGAPVLWPGCYKAEWVKPLWYQVVKRVRNRIPVLNLAAGSCYPWERQPKKISDHNDIEYLKNILSFCRLTTVRDTLAQELCLDLGTNTPLLPCSALLAAKDYYSKPSKDGPIIINFMDGGGHYEWDQGIDPNNWRSIVLRLIERIRHRHKLMFLCHNQSEYDLAQNLDSTIPRLFPKNSDEYFTATSEAVAAICNRMHASVGLAGLGIPSVAIGTDTRLKMVETLGLPVYYVKHVDLQLLENVIEGLVSTFTLERERLIELKSKTKLDYKEVISSTIGQHSKL